ncbi:MAG: hypothetical protein ACRDWI_18300 [Jiangellaceae bacterium]
MHLDVDPAALETAGGGILAAAAGLTECAAPVAAAFAALADGCGDADASDAATRAAVRWRLRLAGLGDAAGELGNAVHAAARTYAVVDDACRTTFTERGR